MPNYITHTEEGASVNAPGSVATGPAPRKKNMHDAALCTCHKPAGITSAAATPYVGCLHPALAQATYTRALLRVNADLGTISVPCALLCMAKLCETKWLI